MKLADAATFDLHEARGAVHVRAVSEGWGRLYSFAYPNYEHDPRPRVLVLGQWRHPTSGNDLIVGLNLNYLNQQQVVKLQRALPQILRSRNLQQRYWVGRRLLPDVFKIAFRSYRRDYIDAVTPDTLRFGRQAARRQAARQQDVDRQIRLARAAALLQKQRERVDQARAQEPAEPPSRTDVAANQLQAALQALTAQQRQQQEPAPAEVQPTPEQPPPDMAAPPVAAAPDAASKPQQELADLAGEPSPEEVEQERNLPVEPDRAETLEGQTGSDEAAGDQSARAGEPAPEEVEQDDLSVEPDRAEPLEDEAAGGQTSARAALDQKRRQLGAECRLGPAGPQWASAASYVRWHDPDLVGTHHPSSGRPILEHGCGPVLAVYDVVSGRTVIDRASDHAALLQEAGWDYDHTVRFLKHGGAVLALADDLPLELRPRLVSAARQRAKGLDLLTEA